jgi:broad specificity polyphosphatase/5'/3'-nucleotidase SurE
VEAFSCKLCHNFVTRFEEEMKTHLHEEHEIVVVAPNENKSASSSALTLDRALQPIENICQWHIWHIDIKNRIV